MLSASRNLALSLLAVFAMFATGCKSNNEGKIVGKWAGEGGIPVFEFTADGKFTATALGATITSGKYSLGTSDTVNLSGLTPPMDGKARSRERITISGDKMTVAGNGGKNLTFTRMK